MIILMTEQWILIWHPSAEIMMIIAEQCMLCLLCSQCGDEAAVHEHRHERLPLQTRQLQRVQDHHLQVPWHPPQQVSLARQLRRVQDRHLRYLGILLKKQA